MLIIKTKAALARFLTAERQAGKRIGFVPTMGALHAGHLSLIEKSNSGNDLTVVSIFVNPTQFNDPKDLEKYPVTIEKDIEMLVAVGARVLFLPPVQEMYPDEASKSMDYKLGYIGSVYEAAARPGHFNGVALVVKKLLEAVQPDNLYMGQKDYQQLQVVRQLIHDFKLQVNLVMCPIVREADGLAMSSRNVRLSPEARQVALTLSKALFHLTDNIGNKPLSQLLMESRQLLNLQPAINVEYLEIADALTLMPVDADEPGKSKVALLAATVGGGAPVG